ncbi:TWiK family of potassium channels protein 18 [Toxocara canis]|uniref:TWiK family of potassium channels protein 18 n=1 Tax=Toxocara canis TaxID=6265 RepID=A0A0B2VGX8_TOXCA|nr:TWiK family of potassium channels protein 18 [Toxocara canis]
MKSLMCYLLQMCISNEHAVHLIRTAKRIYHKYGLGHIILFSCYIAFLLLSASIFYIIESTYSTSVRRQWQHKLSDQRSRFISDELLPQIFNNTRLLVFIHEDKSQYLMRVVNEKLAHYEKKLKIGPPMPALPCTFTNSLLFICSTVTTIGYGYIYPVTKAGRYLSICCALFGIPFTILIIKDLAYLLAKILNYPCVLLAYLWHIFRYCTLQPVDETELLRRIHGEGAVPRSDFRLSTMDRLLDIPVMVAIMALIGWTTLGCVIVHLYLPSVDSSLAFYFIFNSLATIGVGDVDPGENPVLLLSLFAYLLVGLSIVSLFINLMHTNRVYWLPGRLYMPLPTHHSRQTAQIDIASFDSYDDELNNISDCPLNHYVTLGVLQADDKCPLIGAIRKEHAYIDADTQTLPGEVPPLQRRPHIPSPEALIIQKPYSSRDDVNDLIVETYGGRPPRLITRINK